MVFAVKESKAKKIFRRYGNHVAAISMGKAKGFSENGLELSYKKMAGFMPDNDTINAVIGGDVKAKKVINEAVKALYSPTKEESQDICIAMTQLINMLNVKKKKETRPNVLVFVLDDDWDADTGDKARVKFLLRYISALFAEFGLKVITDEEVVDKIFRMKKVDLKEPKEGASKKKIKKYNAALKEALKDRRTKIVRRILEARENKKGYKVSNKGLVLKRHLQLVYGIELRQGTLSQIGIDNIGRVDRAALINGLRDVYTNDNLRDLCEVLGDGKRTEKACKKLRNRNRKAVESYKILRKLLKGVADVKLPKVESGYKKKNRKDAKKGKPKMDTKKFIKFFGKGSNRDFLALVYAHTTCLSFGVELGSSEYNKTIKPCLEALGDEAFVKAFISAAKAWGKNDAKVESAKTVATK